MVFFMGGPLKKNLCVATLRYVDGNLLCVLFVGSLNLKKRVYLRARQLDQGTPYWNLKVLSTDHGILSHTEAWILNLGGAPS